MDIPHFVYSCIDGHLSFHLLASCQYYLANNSHDIFSQGLHNLWHIQFGNMGNQEKVILSHILKLKPESYLVGSSDLS